MNVCAMPLTVHLGNRVGIGALMMIALRLCLVSVFNCILVFSAIDLSFFCLAELLCYSLCILSIEATPPSFGGCLHVKTHTSMNFMTYRYDRR